MFDPKTADEILATAMEAKTENGTPTEILLRVLTDGNENFIEVTIDIHTVPKCYIPIESSLVAMLPTLANFLPQQQPEVVETHGRT